MFHEIYQYYKNFPKLLVSLLNPHQQVGGKNGYYDHFGPILVDKANGLVF